MSWTSWRLRSSRAILSSCCSAVTGIEQDGATYLVPYDADVRTNSTLKYTSLPEADVREQLSKIPAKGLILAFDMCRSDPRKGEKGIAQDNLMGRQAKDLRIVPASDGAADQSGPRAVVTLFSCSPSERSWEWQAKGRGYFSYFLEQGLRSGAADSKGVVRVSFTDLVSGKSRPKRRLP